MKIPFRLSCLTMLVMAASAATSFARDFRVNQIPNGARFSCLNCHTSSAGGGPRNAFGRAVEALVQPGLPTPFWSPALAAQDSDGDGFTNGQELGDPDGDGKATAGATVTNPGLASSKPANKAPTIQITSPASGATVTPPANLEVQASAADADGTVAKVEFFLEGNLAFTATAAPYIYSVPASSLIPHTYNITVKATDNLGATATSAAIQVTIAAAAPPEPTTISAIVKTDQGFRVTWTGGKGPFILQQKVSLSDLTWIDGPTTTNSEATISTTSATAFFRVADQSGVQ